MKNMILVLICCALIIPALGVSEKTGSITGTVVDPDGKALAGAKVTLSGGPLGSVLIPAVADATGRFNFPGLQPGNDYSIKAELHRDGLMTGAGIAAGIAIKVGKRTDITITVQGLKDPFIDVKSNKPVYLAPFMKSVMEWTSKDGLTPLHMAASRESKDEAERFIAEGADPNIKTADGWTPLHVAAREGSLAVAELLLSKGAAVNSGDENGWTPLHSAAAGGSLEVAALLLAKGASVKTKTTDGWTPLHAVMQSGNLPLAKMLIAKGADVNAKNAAGETPLHLAAGQWDEDVITLLIAKGADVNARDKAGRTPIVLAEKENELEMIDLLKKHGARR